MGMVDDYPTKRVIFGEIEEEGAKKGCGGQEKKWVTFAEIDARSFKNQRNWKHAEFGRNSHIEGGRGVMTV